MSDRFDDMADTTSGGTFTSLSVSEYAALRTRIADLARQAYADGRDAGIGETAEHCKELTENAMDTDDLLAIPRRLRSLKTKGASNPDPGLSSRGVYAEAWDSPQAQDVRKLRADRDHLLAALKAEAIAQARAALSWWADGHDSYPAEFGDITVNVTRNEAGELVAEEVQDV